MPEKNRIFSRNFILLTLVAGGSFATFQFSMTVIPLYTLSIGGKTWDIGLIAGIIALSSTGARLLAGILVDRIGRKPVLYIGAGALIVSTLLYHVAQIIPTLLLVRLIHGIGFGAVHLTSTVLITDITPKERWGEGQGYFTGLTILSLAVAPPLGFILYENAGFSWVFIVTTLIALSALVLALFIPETAKGIARHPSETARRPLVERGAFLPSSIVALTTWGHGAIVAFLPLFTTERHILNPGLYFTSMSVMGIVCRGIIGKMSDRYGRGVVLVPGLLTSMSGLVVLHFATNTPLVMVAGMLFGLGFSSVQPVILAITAERVPAERRGTAMGMVSASNDLGITAGSFLAGPIITQTGFSLVFFIAASLVGVAIAVFLMAMRHDLRHAFRLNS